MNVSLNHQPILSPLLKELCERYDLQFPEYSFANIFAFRRQHRYVIVDGDPPYIMGQFLDEKTPFITPTLHPEEFLKRYPQLKNQCLYPIPESWLSSLQRYKKTSERADSDYLFKPQKFQLKGRHLSSRRNLLHQLEEHYSLEIVPLSQNRLADALKVLNGWQQTTGKSEEETDYFPNLDTLENFTQLELFGQIAYADGVPFGYTIGEKLTTTTVLLHQAKSLHQYKGAIPFLYQEFAKSLDQTTKWINMEQDLGMPNLRQAKLAYEPDFLLPKWRVFI